MERTIDKIENLQGRIDRFKQMRDANASVDLSDLDVEEWDDDETRDALEVGQKLVFKMAHLDVERWYKDLQRDKDQLLMLYNAARSIGPQNDAKLTELKRLIAERAKNPPCDKHGQANRKVLVFTAFADTAIYLYNALEAWATTELGIHCALVTGSAQDQQATFGKAEFNHILTNFAPVAKRRAQIKTMPQDGAIDLLIATDCISEGQNLQDCGYLVNYDIHWNPVRIIQRFGRIDRIGSLHEQIQLVNFWPTQDLNKYINLKNRVEARMALVDIAATFDDNMLAPAELETLVTDELRYRDKQLLRLKDEVLDLEDFSESVALNEFTLDDFRIELTRYLESNRQALKEAPLCLYAVVPPDPRYAVITPGVIFCLRQKGDGSGNETVNPLQPYFLVYIRDDGEVRFNFAQPKQILELYRVLCTDRPAAHEALCDLFDQQTANGAHMTVYNTLLQRAVDSIVSTFRRRALTNLQSSRSALLIDQRKQAQGMDDFELITWLVIK